MKTRTLIIFSFLCLFGIYAVRGNADDLDWPRWRGPKGAGISLETDWNPAALAGGPQVLWKSNVGLGYSNVAVKDNRLYTMGITRDGNIVVCLNADTGEELWRFAFEDGHVPQSTPATDGKFVYALNTNGILLCLKAKNGKVRWKKDLVSEYDVVKPFYGFAGSPVMEGGLIILTANTYGIALDKKTGKKVWGSDKPPENLRQREGLPMSSSTGPHYATPVLYDYEGKRFAVITSYVGIHSVDVETGKVLWLYKWEPFRNIHVSDPLIFNSNVFIAQYKGRGSVLLDIGGGEPKVLWKNLNMSSDVSSPVLINGYIYGCEGGPEVGSGLLRCLDVETGEVMWEDGLRAGSYPRMETASLISAAGKLIILEDDGTLHIAEATPVSYKEISSCDVLGGERRIRMFWTPPVLYKGKIYCRNYAGDLVCIDVSK